MKLFAILLMFFLAAALLPSTAAAKGQGNLTCSVSTNGISFGAYDPLSSTALEVSGSITTVCTKHGRGWGQGGGNGVGPPWGYGQVPYSITLSAGSSGSFSARALHSGGNALNYNLYTDSTYSVIAGDGSSGSQPISGQVALNGWQGSGSSTNTVFGKIPPSQNAAPGAYVDLLIVTVNY